NCLPSEIAVVENASRAWSLAFGSIAFLPGDIVITTTFEYANNYIAIMQAKKRYGIRVCILENTETGGLLLAGLNGATATGGSRRATEVTDAPTHNGVVNPYADFGRIVRAAKASEALSPRAVYIVDGCQSVGQLHIDVQDAGVDILTTCSRKYLRGPRGVGLL